MGSLRYTWALLGMVMKSGVQQRGAMITRGVLSIITHCTYIPIWFIFFSYMPSMSGWGLPQALMAYGLSIACWGLVSIPFFGLRLLPQHIEHGELDSYLTLPQPVVISAALSSSKSSGLGEVVFGVALCLYAGIHYNMGIAWIPLFLMLGTIVFASGILFFGSLGFWVRQFYASAEEIYFNFNLLASRPAPIFTGFMYVLSLTLVPVAFMTHIPVEYLDTHRASLLVFVVIGTLAYAVFAVGFFYLGLKHYESGNRFGVRG